MANNSLKASRDKKDDEFYTRREDIENELSQYDLSQFKDKVVYCNCDDPTWSNFFLFFTKWGKKLGIKQVHFTNYANKDRVFGQLDMFDALGIEESRQDDLSGRAHHWIYDISKNKIIKEKLMGNGDFRSEECLNILKKCDIIITNPPFSLLTEFISTLISYNKKFLIIGNENEVASRSWCNYFSEGKIWLGYTHPKQFVAINGSIKKLGYACWYTNLNVSYRNQPLILHQQNIDDFERYDNYDAIEIPRIKLIPDNYYGNMGVPITFVETFCPQQFEIIDTRPAYAEVPKINGKKVYRRLIIRRKR